MRDVASGGDVVVTTVYVRVFPQTSRVGSRVVVSTVCRFQCVSTHCGAHPPHLKTKPCSVGEGWDYPCKGFLGVFLPSEA